MVSKREISESETKDGDGLYTRQTVAKLFRVPESRLRYWSQTGFVKPGVRQGGRVFYTFRDLVAIKVAVGLLDAGLPLQRVRAGLDSLRERLPGIDAPLSAVRVRCDQDRVVVEYDERTFEATSGQMLLDFDINALQEELAEVISISRESSSKPKEERTAFEWYQLARELEEKWDRSNAEAPEAQEALEAYEQSIELDSGFAAAWTNLGSLLADMGDFDGARDHFDQALRCDPEQPEAAANLAELALRMGDIDIAIEGFREVLRTSPDHLEAHYGLARALLEVGGRGQALAHLERFCSAIECLDDSDMNPDLEHRHACARDAIGAIKRSPE